MRMRRALSALDRRRAVFFLRFIPNNRKIAERGPYRAINFNLIVAEPLFHLKNPDGIALLIS